MQDAARTARDSIDRSISGDLALLQDGYSDKLDKVKKVLPDSDKKDFDKLVDDFKVNLRKAKYRLIILGERDRDTNLFSVLPLQNEADEDAFDSKLKDFWLELRKNTDARKAGGEPLVNHTIIYPDTLKFEETEQKLLNEQEELQKEKTEQSQSIWGGILSLSWPLSVLWSGQENVNPPPTKVTLNALVDSDIQQYQFACNRNDYLIAVHPLKPKDPSFQIPDWYVRTIAVTAIAKNFGKLIFWLSWCAFSTTPPAPV